MKIKKKARVSIKYPIIDNIKNYKDDYFIELPSEKSEFYDDSPTNEIISQLTKLIIENLL